MIRASRNFAKRNQSEDRQLLHRAEAAQRLQGGDHLRGGGVAPDPGSVDFASHIRSTRLGDEGFRRSSRVWFCHLGNDLLGL